MWVGASSLTWPPELMRDGSCDLPQSRSEALRWQGMGPSLLPDGSRVFLFHLMPGMPCRGLQVTKGLRLLSQFLNF